MKYSCVIMLIQVCSLLIPLLVTEILAQPLLPPKHPFSSNEDRNLFTDNKANVFSIHLSWVDELLFYGNIEIGGCTFKVTFDTMDDMLWIPSVKTNAKFWKHKNKYDESATGTAYKKRVFMKDHAGGAFIGRFFTDNVTVASITLLDFVFCAVHIFPPNTGLPLEVDGNVGLSRGVLHEHIPATLLQTMYRARAITRKMFCIELCPKDDYTQGWGSIAFGESCPIRAIGQKARIFLTESEYWSFNITQIRYHETRTSVAPMPVFVDTSGHYIWGPTSYTDSINKNLRPYKIEESKCYVRCTEIDDLPAITFISGTTEIRLDAKKYIIKTPDGECYSAFRGSGYKTRIWKFGIPFNRFSMVTYDDENNVIELSDAQCT